MTATTYVPKLRDQSPWGTIDHVTPRGDQGIVFVSTSSHGGFYVPIELIDRIPQRLRDRAAAWGSYQWFEEDCEWAAVALSFPEVFDDNSRYQAICSLVNYTDDETKAWMHAERQDDVAWAEQYKAANGDKFQQGGGCSGCGPEGKHWGTRAYSIDGKTSIGWLEDWRDGNWEKLPTLPYPFTIEDAKKRAYNGQVTVEALADRAA